MYSFDYHRPDSLKAAVAAAAVDDGAFLAGGMTLLPALKMRLSRRSGLVDLSGIAELKGIRVDGDRVHVGAMSRHMEVEDSAVLRKSLPALAQLAGGIGDPHVRNRGTLGGSLANSDPSERFVLKSHEQRLEGGNIVGQNGRQGELWKHSFQRRKRCFEGCKRHVLF